VLGTSSPHPPPNLTGSPPECWLGAEETPTRGRDAAEEESFVEGSGTAAAAAAAAAAAESCVEGSGTAAADSDEEELFHDTNDRLSPCPPAEPVVSEMRGRGAGMGCREPGHGGWSGFEVRGLGYRVQGVGFRVCVESRGMGVGRV